MASNSAMDSTNTHCSSRDIAWRHCELIKDEGKSKYICLYCRKLISGGGIHRVKEHLAGRKGNVAPCKSVPAEIRYQMTQNLGEVVSDHQKRQKIIEDYVDAQTSASPISFSVEPKPLLESESPQTNLESSAKDKGKVVPDVVEGSRKKSNRLAREAGNSIVPCSVRGGQASSKGALLGKVVKENVDMAIGRFFFDSAIPFDGVKSFYFQQMVDAISAISPGYEVPTYQDMRGRILKKVLEEVKSHIQTYRKYWASLGCTIMVDGWSDGRGMTLINFLVYCPKGTVFLRSVNASEIVESAESMYALFKEVVEEVGVNNVVQIITDNVESYAIAGNMLCETYPSIFWSPCAARCIDLILFKIGEIEEVKKVIRTAREITKFIYNHATVLNMMRKFTNGKELVWPSSTRSATNFLTLQSMVAQKDGLRAMVTSKDWLDSAYAKKSNGTLVVDILLDSHFWTSCTQVIRYTEPLLRVLRMVDSEQRPAMGYIYEAMLRVKDAIRIAFKSKKSDYMPIWDIVDSQWDRQLQRPLHAAGYVLNPACFFSPGFSDDHPGVTTGILDCIERLVSGQRNHDKVIKELNVYKSSGGDFGRSMAIRARNTMLPSDWWSTFGGQCPNLKRLAMRVLSQTCSASGYECDWSVFVRMHTTKSNRLEHKRLTDLVFVHYNLRLRQRENAKMKLIDPIALENIDTSEEWVVEFEPSMLEGDDDMDWMTLDRPIVGEDIPLELMSMEVGDGNTQVEQLGEEEDGTDIQ